MSRPVRFSPSTIRQARALVSTATSVDELRAAQAVLLAVDHHLNRAQVAALLGVAAATVGRLRQHARKPAAQKKTGRRGFWGGRRRCLMTLEEEKAFLEPWAHQAHTAGMLIVGPLQAALAQKLGRKIRPSVAYRMLARHGWRKLTPDTRHPKSDPVKQADWKKNSRRWWPKPLLARPPRGNAPD